MVPITSGDVLAMSDASAEVLLTVLNARAGRRPWMATLLFLVAFGAGGWGALVSAELYLEALRPESPAAVPTVAPLVSTYTVKRGDNLTTIARKHDVTIEELRAWNQLSGDVIEVSQELVVVASEPALAASNPAASTEPAPAQPSSMDPRVVLALAFAVVAGSGAFYARWRHHVNSTTILIFELDADAKARVGALYDAIDTLGECAALWHIVAESRTHEWKRTGGASTLINRSRINVNRGDPPRIRTNVPIPSLRAGREILYFLPDRLLVYDNLTERYGAVPYREVDASVSTTRFIESGSVPRDAEVVDHTWEKVNRTGGPDRRFNNNRQLPVCRYGEVTLCSVSGLNEQYQVSRAEGADPLVAALGQMEPLAVTTHAPLPSLQPSGPATLGTLALPPGGISPVEQKAAALICLLKFIAAADRKFTDAERAIIRAAVLDAFRFNPWVVAHTDNLIEIIRPQEDKLAEYLGFFADASPEERRQIFKVAESIARADGKATAKERERMGELSSGLQVEA